MTTLDGPGRWPAKHLPRALLGHVMETLLSEHTPHPGALTVRVFSPWDAWWVCYRAGLPLEALQALGVAIALPEHVCTGCARDALALAEAPSHPGADGGRDCGCLRTWAVRMRAPAPEPSWPDLSLTVALAKPGAPRELIRAELRRSHHVLATVPLTLTTDDTRRLYPEAYGADYVAARDAYLTSGPALALVLRAATKTAAAVTVKARIRGLLGGDRLANHLHMPDNPGEALADIGHLAGTELLRGLYERYERDRAEYRLGFYRAALGIGSSNVDCRAR
jgi:hypothetical protein